jgi:uncharacterized protein YchJ
VKICLALVAVTCALAQTPEETLRARVSKFYQAYADGKARTMEPMVAEDTKDNWFASEKTRYGSFEIDKIEFNDDRTRAKVIVLAETTMRIRGTSFTGKVPTVSNWKIEDGEWRYFIDPNDQVREARKVRIPEPSELLGKVTASKSEVRLCGCGEPVFDVAINNAMPGEVRLTLEPVEVPGLLVSLQDRTLKARQSTKLVIEYDGAEKPPVAPVPVTIKVDPTGERIVIKLIFATTN